MDFTQLVRTCTGDPGRVPYDYQRRIAEHGLPEVLHAPTGSGKTLAMVLGWLYRRRFHPDAAVRAETPRWLVFCLPMRTLVEQVERQVTGWLANSGLTDVRMHVFMGGEPAKRKEWRVTAPLPTQVSVSAHLVRAPASVERDNRRALTARWSDWSWQASGGSAGAVEPLAQPETPLRGHVSFPQVGDTELRRTHNRWVLVGKAAPRGS